MKPGDMAEYGMWLDGRETPEQRRAHEATCQAAFRMAEQQHNIKLGPVTYTEKRPGEDRVPPVPGHISGPNVRLLIAEAKVIATVQPLVTRSFLADLDLADLKRLQAITRRVHHKANPMAMPLTDEACNQIIEELGPEAAIDAIKMAMQSKAFH